MPPHPNRKVQNASEIAADHMDAILALFKPGSLITVLVRQPNKPDGSRDFILSNDTLDGAIEALTLRKTAPTIIGDV